MAKRSKSSSRWMQEHLKDEYVLRAQKEGWRSRAVYKLMEIQEKEKLLRPGMTVIDLGAAPGGWSQYATSLLDGRGSILALDLLAMDSLPEVEFIQGDFTEQAVLEQLLERLGERKADLVMSDMAPNMSGMNAVDQPRAIYLAELTLDLAQKVLKPGGFMLVKLFHGQGFDEYVATVKKGFGRVKVRKPKASRPRSRETYLLAGNYGL
ncbi:MAG: 23S rRNA (uridine(2552)-2'-O)-methyltransferase RlmE [Gammaproteobacteria bacterium]|nr:23S rRNA (uridine(2552)-2'-O)-methyltransferase RlmE [Gammaproteobacteria bacterium]